jgi:hypothetical protein
MGEPVRGLLRALLRRKSLSLVYAAFTCSFMWFGSVSSLKPETTSFEAIAGAISGSWN